MAACGHGCVHPFRQTLTPSICSLCPLVRYLLSPDAPPAVRVLLFPPAAYPVGSSTYYVFFVVVHPGIVYRFEIPLALLSR